MQLCFPTLWLTISIHAPRVGSDGAVQWMGVVHPYISIHAPRVGSDASFTPWRNTSERFQSTLPVWGATVDLQTADLHW